MAELENWRYEADSDLKTREILEISHQVPQVISNISGQPRTRYKQPFANFIQTLIGDIFTHQTFNRDHPNEVRITPFFGHHYAVHVLIQQKY